MGPERSRLTVLTPLLPRTAPAIRVVQPGLVRFSEGEGMPTPFFGFPEGELPFDYEICGTCGYDHVYDGCDPDVYRRIKEAHEAAERKERAMKGCICTAGDPCDYHAATCVTCIGGCQGHPVSRFDPEQDAAHRAAEFEHNITTRVAEMRKPHIPRYWLENKDGEHMVFVLVGLRQPGDGPDPRSWIRYNYPEDDMQLATADQACRRLCRPAHMSQDWGETEESGDAIWYGYYFSPERWEQIQDVLMGLLGEPGTAPPRLFAKE